MKVFRLARRSVTWGSLTAVAVSVALSGTTYSTTASTPQHSTSPVAVLSLDPTASPLKVTVDGSLSTDDVSVTGYTIDWGDGTTRWGPEEEATATHTYAKPGNYVVSLTAMDADGHTGTATRVAHVGRTGGAGGGPGAKVTATAKGGSGVQVSAADSTAPRGVKGYTFDFGDGSSTVRQPMATVRHSYAHPGSYKVTATVTDNSGATSSSSSTVTAGASTAPTSSGKRIAGTGLRSVATTPQPTVVTFTFDDTLDNQAPAISVLHQYGMHGTLYVNSPRIGTAGYFSKAQLDSYQAAGDEIAGHTISHVDLTTVSTSEAQRQVCNDRVALLNMGYRVKNFAYPFGATNASVKTIVQNCGYNSAREVADLLSPGYGCTGCDTAETIPPQDRWQIRTNQSIQSDTTLAMIENYVTQAENDRGGWVPLLFHNICSGCASNSMDIDTFTQFVDWLSHRPSTTTVKTVDQVIGGSLQPGVSAPPSSDPTSVTVGGQVRTLDGINIYRSANFLVMYTPAKGATTGTNEFGTEAAVVNGVVTTVQTGVGNMAIPSNGYVLSGHGTSNTWLKTYAKVGTAVSFK